MRKRETVRSSGRGTSRLLAAAACAFALACGDAAPPSQAQATAVPAAPVAPSVGTSAGVTYRWLDGDWILRATFMVTNPTASVLMVSREAFRASQGAAWSAASTLPENAAVPAGGSVSGDIAWFVPGRSAQRLSAAHAAQHARRGRRRAVRHAPAR